MPPRALLLVGALVLGVSSAQASTAQASRSLEPTRRSLRSSDPMVRLRAFYTLSEAGLSAALADELLALLETENALIYSVNRMGTSPSDVLGEGWGEYYALVRGACKRYCGASNRVYAALADGAYNEDSPGMRDVARDHGRAILGRLLERSSSDVAGARVQAVKMLGVVAEFSQQFTVAEKGSIRQEVLKAVQDASYPVREAGILAMGTVGSAADVPLLQRIATTDPNRVATRSGRGVYPLRVKAERAIRRIAARTSAPRR